jgi:hypothetical protein
MEEKQQNSEPSHRVDERDRKGELGRSTSGKISGIVIGSPVVATVNSKEVSYAEAAVGKMTKQQEKVEEQKAAAAIVTNQQFLETKLNNCKKFVDSIEYLKNTSLLKAFQELSPRQVLEWVIWMKQEGKSVDTGISELFAVHNLTVEKLKSEEFEKIKLYFICFQTLATKQY